MKVRQRRYAGAVCEIEIFSVSDRVKDPANAERRLRFKNDEERRKHREGIALRRHIRGFNAAFDHDSLYSTLTFDLENEVHTFPEAKEIRRRFAKELKKRFPGAVLYIYLGRGKNTNRIHLHMVSAGVPEEVIREVWVYGSVVECKRLRRHNKTPEGVDCGEDFTGLATYLFNHWTPEQGGQRCYKTRNGKRPEKEEPEEIRGAYSVRRVPAAPRGYRLIEAKATTYGYLYFKYVRDDISSA